MFRVNKIDTTERRHWRRSRVYIVNSEHILHFFLVFLLLTLKGKCLLWLYLKVVTRLTRSWLYVNGMVNMFNSFYLLNGNYVVLVKAIHKRQGADNIINSAAFDWIRFKVIFYLLVKQIVHILFTWKLILPKSFCSLLPCRNLFWNTWTHFWLIILFPQKSLVNLWLSGAFKRYKMGTLAKKSVKGCYKRLLQARKYWRYCKMV